MANESQLATSAAIIHSRDPRRKTLLINGKEFPYQFSLEPITVKESGSGLRFLTITIPVDGPVSLYDQEALS